MSDSPTQHAERQTSHEVCGGVSRRLSHLLPTSPTRVLPKGWLRTSRLTLRPLLDHDRDEFTAVIRESEPYTSKLVPLRAAGESDTAAFERIKAHIERGDRTGKEWRRAAVLHDRPRGGRIVGMVSLILSRGLEFRGHVAWWVAVDARRRGFGTEIARATLEYALAELPEGLGLHVVEAAVSLENTPGRRLAQAAGMTLREGEYLSHRIDGEWKRHEVWAREVAPAPSTIVSDARSSLIRDIRGE